MIENINDSYVDFHKVLSDMTTYDDILQKIINKFERSRFAHTFDFYLGKDGVIYDNEIVNKTFIKKTISFYSIRSEKILITIDKINNKTVTDEGLEYFNTRP